MICQSCCHRRRTLLPLSTMDRPGEGHVHCLMWTHKIDKSVFQANLAIIIVTPVRK